MTRAPLSAVFVLAIALAACGKGEDRAAQPKPAEPTAASVAHFCGMSLIEHTGPKGQIFLKEKAQPIWFSSVRDAFAFLFLPEEPKEIAAIYVNDFAKAKDWDHPEAGAWVEAKAAWYVVGSDYVSGMNEREIAPFSEKAAARNFAAAHGGRVASFTEVKEEDVLTAAGEPAAQ